MEEEDIKKDNKEVLVIIEYASSKGRGDNKDIFNTIKAFKE